MHVYLGEQNTSHPEKSKYLMKDIEVSDGVVQISSLSFSKERGENQSYGTNWIRSHSMSNDRNLKEEKFFLYK